MKEKAIISTFISLVILCIPATGKTIYVDDDGPADFNNIQAAIDDANDGDSILVVDGTYTGNGNRDIDFKGKAITVKSENGPKNCIIDCQGSKDEYHRGFYFQSGEDANSIVQGFTITNGYTNQIPYEYPSFSRAGGGLFFLDSSPCISDCIIFNNEADDGGGIATINSSARISNCTIKDNIASVGGGIFYENGSPVIEDCCIEKNQAAFGGGVYCSSTEGDFFVLNCIIKENIAKSTGGGLICGKGAIVSGCLIVGNVALEDYHYRLGVAWDRGGGGVAFNGEGSVLINCTISENKANTGSGILGGCDFDYVKWTYIYSCIVWGNSGDDNNQIVISPCCLRCVRLIPPVGISAYNCCFQGTPTVPDYGPHQYYGPYINFENCINIDPCFANPGYWDPNGTPDNPNDDFWIEGDYHLKSQAGRFDPNTQSWVQDDVTSPCIDAGDPMSPIGYEPFPNGGFINMGTYGGTAEASKSYFGEPVCETIVAGDINGDCIVDFADIEILLLHWLEEY